MRRFSPSSVNKIGEYVSRKKILRESVAEFFNHGIGYIAGVLAYNNLSVFFEVKSFRNLWGVANFRKKTLVSQDTFELMEFVISGLVGFLIFKLVTRYSAKAWTWYERKYLMKDPEDTR